MVSEWKKIPKIEGYIEDWDRIFIVPREANSVIVYYGDWYCIVNNISVQEAVNKLKVLDNGFMATKGAVKSLISNALNN